MSVSNIRKKIALLANERNQLENECLNIRQFMTRASIKNMWKEYRVYMVKEVEG